MAKGSNKEERRRRKLQRGWPKGREGRSSEGTKPSGIEITKCVDRERKTRHGSNGRARRAAAAQRVASVGSKK